MMCSLAQFAWFFSPLFYVRLRSGLGRHKTISVEGLI